MTPELLIKSTILWGTNLQKVSSCGRFQFFFNLSMIHLLSIQKTLKISLINKLNKDILTLGSKYLHISSITTVLSNATCIASELHLSYTTNFLENITS